MRCLELLSPAADKQVAIEAILHGADAVYMGASSHGARKSAANTVDDIAEVVAFAHQYRAKVYITVNTLVYDNEISKVESLIRDLYRCGVDAIIVQDMGILRMDIPPIELHASTQCDTRDVQKAKFLQECGFSQIVLARELSISEISEICKNVDVPVECFVHGALCVSYSGKCRASQVKTRRSANRGECSQMCRLSYDLMDADGKVLLKDKYLLSLRDFNASSNMVDLVEAGVSSFKIEGRLKDASYVKNITAYYRNILDSIISSNPDKYCRSSFGVSEITFEPDPEKSFNRGFTTYFQGGRQNQRMASMLTPKSMGEKITDISSLNNGDGISFMNAHGEYEGVRVNKIEKGRIVGAKPFFLPPGAEIRRTFDIAWQTALAKPTAKRSVSVDIEIDETGISASDERGVKVRLPLDVDKSVAQKRMEPEKILGKLGNTIYRLRKFNNNLSDSTFIPASQLNALKRRLIEALDAANIATYPFSYRRKENLEAKYISDVLGAEENVANKFAEKFYSDHGSSTDMMAIEVSGLPKEDTVVMTTRYCLRRELGICKKNKNGSDAYKNAREPFYIKSGRNRFRLQFDCNSCEMRVVAESPSSTGG